MRPRLVICVLVGALVVTGVTGCRSPAKSPLQCGELPSLEIVKAGDQTFCDGGALVQKASTDPSAYALSTRSSSSASMTFTIDGSHPTPARGPWSADEGQHAGLVFCAKDVDDHYLVLASVPANQLQLVAVVGGTETVLVRQTPSRAINGAITIVASCRDGITATFADASGPLGIVTSPDRTYTSGTFGPHVFATDAHTTRLIASQ